MKYKGSQKTASEVGRELSVGSLLEGSVRKAGNRVRITAQLIDTATEGHLWAQNYDRQLEDIFAIQSEIAEKVAGELKIRLVEDERRLIEQRPTENTEAYTFYLRGKRLLGERTEPAYRQALEALEKAVELDPSFAKADAGIAECWVYLVSDGYEAYERAAPKAELSAKKALSLNPELAEAHATLANVDFLEDDIRGAEAEARRAIELNPSLPDAYDLLSDVALLKNDVDGAVKAIEAAYRLDPIVPRIVGRLGRFYLNAGRENDALQHWEKTAQLAPADTYRNMTEYYLSKGDTDKAREYYSRAAKLEPTNRWVLWMKGFMAARMGDKSGALAAIKEIEAKWLGATNLNDIAFVMYALEDLDSYFAYAERATDQHTLRYSYVMYSPLFAKAREDPRYQALLGKLKKLTETT
jgi:serine/threonine-protein kinase